jgi:hypothetical protein
MRSAKPYMKSLELGQAIFGSMQHTTKDAISTNGMAISAAIRSFFLPVSRFQSRHNREVHTKKQTMVKIQYGTKLKRTKYIASGQSRPER